MIISLGGREGRRGGGGGLGWVYATFSYLNDVIEFGTYQFLNSVHGNKEN